MARKNILYSLGLILAFTGGYLGSSLQIIPSIKEAPLPTSLPKLINSQEIRQSGYRYINPLLECETDSPIENNVELFSLKRKLETQVDNIYKDGQVKRVALYFRDLNNGPWFGINESDTFTPASLLKTPIMLAYLKQSEKDPTLLGKKIKYIPEDNPPESPTPGIASLKPFASYSVEELLNRMIVYSDNNAFNLLTLNIDYNNVLELHNDLGLTIPDETTPEDFISVSQYAGIFRVLFNSSYLSRSMSEKALSILATASYREGLVAGVPDSVEVAHKYGVRKGDEGINQLHDCGIIYDNKHPYLLCVMTKGNNFTALTRTIKELSQTVYQNISTR